MSVNPNFSFWFGMWTSLLLLIGGGTIVLPLGIPHDWADLIKSWALFGGALNSAILTALHGVSSSTPGPLTK